MLFECLSESVQVSVFTSFSGSAASAVHGATSLLYSTGLQSRALQVGPADRSSGGQGALLSLHFDPGRWGIY